METDFFDGKSVLEIGFVTGLPSVYAFENGAEEIAMHTMDKTRGSPGLAKGPKGMFRMILT